MVKNEAKVSLEDAMQPGNQMLAAGYCMYGSSCTVKQTKLVKHDLYNYKKQYFLLATNFKVVLFFLYNIIGSSIFFYSRIYDAG